MSSKIKWAMTAACVFAGAAYPAEGRALQPLSEFIDGAVTTHPTARVARATTKQRDAETSQEWSRLLPSISARGVYTRNQYPVEVALPGGDPITITPRDQLDGFITLDVPLINLAQLARVEVADTQTELAEAQEDLTARNLKEQVVRGYYTVSALWAVVKSAENSLAAAEENLKVVQGRVSAGAAPDLDLSRAEANVERARQDLADAKLSRKLAERGLLSLTGMTPAPASEFPEDDLHPEAPLDRWMEAGQRDLPELRVAKMQLELSEAASDAASYSYAPTLSAQAQERFTNATGFLGRNANYTLSAVLAFHFDFGIPAQQDIADAVLEQSEASAELARRNSEDAILEAHARVETNIVKAQSARVQYAATQRAADLTKERYTIGAATQLDVTQAQRDAFAAEVAKIQADLELAQSRAVLRLAAGQSDLSATPAVARVSQQP